MILSLVLISSIFLTVYRPVSAQDVFTNIPSEVMMKIINFVPSNTTAIDHWLREAKNLSLISKQFYQNLTKDCCLAMFAERLFRDQNNIHDFSYLVRKLYFEVLPLRSLESIGGLKLPLWNWIKKRNLIFDDEIAFMQKSGLSPEEAIKQEIYKKVFVKETADTGENNEVIGYLYESDFYKYFFYRNNVKQETRIRAIVYVIDKLDDGEKFRKPFLTFQPGTLDNSEPNINVDVLKAIKDKSIPNYFNRLSILNFPDFICDSKDYNFYIMGWIKTGNRNTVTLYLDYYHLSSLIQNKSLLNPFSRSISDEERYNCLKQYITSVKNHIESKIQNGYRTHVNICFGNSPTRYILTPLLKTCDEIFSNSLLLTRRIGHEIYGNFSDYSFIKPMLDKLKNYLDDTTYTTPNILSILQYLENNIFCHDLNQNSEFYLEYFLDIYKHNGKHLLKLYLLLNDYIQQNNCTSDKLLQFILTYLPLSRYEFINYLANEGGEMETSRKEWEYNTEGKRQMTLNTTIDKLIPMLQDDFNLGFSKIREACVDDKELMNNITPNCCVLLDILSLTLQHFEMTLRKTKQGDYAEVVRNCRNDLTQTIKIDYSEPNAIIECHSAAASDAQSIVEMEEMIKNTKHSQNHEAVTPVAFPIINIQENDEQVATDNQNNISPLVNTNPQITPKYHPFFSSFLKTCICVGALSLLYYFTRPMFSKKAA